MSKEKSKGNMCSRSRIYSIKKISAEFEILIRKQPDRIALQYTRRIQLNSSYLRLRHYANLLGKRGK